MTTQKLIICVVLFFLAKVLVLSLLFLAVSQMGYGSRAMEMLQQYYEGKIPNLSETESQAAQEAPSVVTEVHCHV